VGPDQLIHVTECSNKVPTVAGDNKNINIRYYTGHDKRRYLNGISDTPSISLEYTKYWDPLWDDDISNPLILTPRDEPYNFGTGSKEGKGIDY